MHGPTGMRNIREVITPYFWGINSFYEKGNHKLEFRSARQFFIRLVPLATQE